MDDKKKVFNKTLLAKSDGMVSFGAYPQASYPPSAVNEKTPIFWHVLDRADGGLFLLSEKILECIRYDFSFKETSWQDSDIRKWLNNEFYNEAFNSEEKTRILLRRCIGNGAGSQNDLPETDDRVFLLNSAEVEKYKSEPGADLRVSKFRASGTHRAKRNGLYVNYLGDYGSDGYSWWWLRNRGFGSKACAAYVHIGGEADEKNNGSLAVRGDLGARPAIILKMED